MVVAATTDFRDPLKAMPSEGKMRLWINYLITDPGFILNHHHG